MILETYGIMVAASFVFKPILEEFAKDVFNDVAKDYVKACFGNVFLKQRKKSLQVALGNAVKELLTIIQSELFDCDYSKKEMKELCDSFRLFIRGKGVQKAIQLAFSHSDSHVNPDLFAQEWNQLPDAPKLPEIFSWDHISKLFIQSIRNLREEDSSLREILIAQAVAEIAHTNQEQAGLAPGFELDKYRDALRERYENLHFETLDTTGAYYNAVKLWSVFVPQNVRECKEYYPPILEIPKEYLQMMYKRGDVSKAYAEISEEIIKERQRAYLDQAEQSILKITDDPQIKRIMILGNPGSGKSTLLRYLAVRWTKENILALPILIELREYEQWNCTGGKSVCRYLHEASTWHRFNQFDLDLKLKTSHSVILLLDGLDEIFNPSHREQIINDIHRFSNEYPDIRIIVTSRVIGYKPQRLVDTDFHHFMLQDLNETQIKNFLDLWHDVTFDNKSDAEFKKERLVKAIEDSKAIRELAGNPLLLTMMAIVNRHQELPRDRARLYEQTSKLLLHAWDTERALESNPDLKNIIGFPEKAEILRSVAKFMQSAPSGLAGNIISSEDLEGILEEYLKSKLGFQQYQAPTRALITQLRERNFIICYLGADYYAFVHRTFLEYFCASAIVSDLQYERKLEFAALKQEIYGRNLNDDSWHEVLCLIAGMIHENDTGEVIDYLLDHKDHEYPFNNIFLAARCYKEIRNPAGFGEKRKKLTGSIEKLLDFEFPYFYDSSEEETKLRAQIRAKAVKFMSHLVDTPDKWLKDRVQWDIRSEVITELTRGWKSDPDTLKLLKELVQDDNWDVRSAAVGELVRGWKSDPDTLKLLKELVQNDDNWYVRRVAVRELAQGWKSDPDTLKLLRELVQNDDNWDVRRAAVRELAQGWKSDPDTLTILKDRIQNDDEGFVRMMAISEIANGWPDDPGTLPLLKDLLQIANNLEVRMTAISELSRGWKSDPDTLMLLKDIILYDNDVNVRLTAITALSFGWPSDPDTLTLLKDLLLNDNNRIVRREAVIELSHGWKTEPDILPLLRDREKNDEDGYVRSTALNELARGWKTDPDILALLKERFQKDTDSCVRIAAADQLLRRWKSDPVSLPLIKEWVQKDDNWVVRLKAVSNLTRFWSSDPDTLLLLKDRLQNDKCEDVRVEVVIHLARGWKSDPDTLTLLKERMQKDDSATVRYKAGIELARGWKNDPDVLAFLKTARNMDKSRD